VLMCSYHRPHSCTHAKECSACKTLHDQVDLPVQYQHSRAIRVTSLFIFPIIPAYGPEGKRGQKEDPHFALKGGPAQEPASRYKGEKFLRLIPLVQLSGLSLPHCSLGFPLVRPMVSKAEGELGAR